MLKAVESAEQPKTTGRYAHRRCPGRTRESQAAKKFRAGLVAMAGPSPSPTTLALIDEAVSLRLRLDFLTRHHPLTAPRPAEVLEEDAHKRGLLHRTLTKLASLAPKAAPPANAQDALREHLAARARERAAAAQQPASAAA